MQSEKFNNWVEIYSALLISIATLLQAWCAYQSTRWTGQIFTHFSASTKSRIEATQLQNRAGQLINLDIGMFAQFLIALNSNPESAKFLLKRFRPEAKTAT